MNDDELLTVVQEGYFRYSWYGAHPIAGMAIEILPDDENLVAVGASGHGIMALLVGVELDRPSCRNASSLAARRISRVELNSNLGDVPLIVENARGCKLGLCLHKLKPILESTRWRR